MLSYRHEYHAGNHADVFKHVVLCELLRYLKEKPTGLWYVDTHAGAGRYELGRHAVADSEAACGIGKLWGVSELPTAVLQYRDLVARINPPGELKTYPGSPWLAAAILQEEDRLWLSELHPADHDALVGTFERRDRRVRIERRDGLAGLRALLPPLPRRALVLVDPSYEVKSDYRSVAEAVDEARRRFATGVYAIWYPMLGRRESAEMPHLLEQVAGPKWLHAKFWVRHSTPTGLSGSGMFVVNPPYTLAETLETSLSRLTELLAQDEGAGHSLEGSRY